MSDLIKDYLARLRKALAGADPATVQDALSDAEEHLWTTLQQESGGRPGADEDGLVSAAIEKYGTPEEVAAAYMEIESKLSPPMTYASPRSVRPSAAARFFGIFTDPRAYASLFYMLFSFFLGTFYFVWTVTGLSISIGIMVLIIGLPFFGFFLVSVRGIALVDGRIVEALLGERMPRRPIFSRTPASWRDRLTLLFTDPMVWKTIGYNLMMLPLGILYFTLTITGLALSLTFFFRPVFEYMLHFPLVQNNNWSYWTPGYLMPVAMLIGVLWFLLTLHMAKGLGRMHARIAKNMLVRD